MAIKHLVTDGLGFPPIGYLITMGLGSAEVVPIFSSMKLIGTSANRELLGQSAMRRVIGKASAKDIEGIG